MQPDDPIATAVRRQGSGPGPVVVRVTGPGAFGAASRWASLHGVLPSLPVPWVPASPEGAVWLHDAPGSRVLADQIAATCELIGGRWVLVLTGPATDGAHPDQGVTVDVPEPVPPGETTPTAVRFELPPDPLVALEQWAREGDVARAHVLMEHLQATDPDAMAPWCWLELCRLTDAGRMASVEAAGPTLQHRQACRGRVLLAMAEAALELGAPDRMEVYLESLRAGPRSEEEEADAAYLDAVSARDLERVQRCRPASVRLQVSWRRVLVATDHPATQPPLPGRLGRVVDCMERGEPAVREAIEVGALNLAATNALDHGHDRGSLYIPTGAVDEAVRAARSASRAGDVEGMRGHLEGLGDDFSGPRRRFAFRGLLMSARVAAHDGAVGALSSHAARLRAMKGSTWATPQLVEDLVPRPGEGHDVWCACTFLRLLEEHLRGDCPTLEMAFAGLPRTPVVLGPYVLETALASGGMGTVWRGRHRLSGREVAVKVLAGTTPGAVRLFRAEIDVVARFDHPMIVSVLDVGEVDARTEQQSGGVLREGQPALVMELVDHGTLADHVGSLPWPDAQAALVGILEALAYAHAHGVIHRDLKPQNVLVGEGNALRLADFGIAGLDEGKVAGTPTYMSPEQFRGGPVGPAADVYAVGCIGWALACGLPPFMGPVQQLATAHASASLPPFEPVTPVPRGFEGWLERCLQKDPGARFPSAAAAAEALLEIDELPQGLPGKAPVTPFAPTGSSTFVLNTLLDLPESVLLPRDEGTATQRLHDIFEDRASWRPRIPTERMLHRGDPPILFQRDAQGELWTHLMVALGRSTRRVVLHGRGTRSIVRWLRRRARISGLDVHEHPVPGKVCIVDATDLDPASLPSARAERWLLIWRNREVAGTHRVQLATLEAGAIWWMVYSRILLHPRTACQVATQAAGIPAIAFALVDDWLEDPGVEMTRAGLRLLGRPVRPAPRAVALWDEAIERAAPARRRLGELMAVKPFPTSGGFAREATGADGSIAPIGIGCNDAWSLPTDLRAALLQPLDAEQIRALHRQSARIERMPVARAIHTCLADPDRANTEAMVDAVADVRAPREVLDLVWLHVNRHLLEAPEMRRRCRLSQMTADDVLGSLTDPDPLVADLATLELFERLLPWPEGHRDRVEAALFAPRRPVLAIRLAHCLSDQLGRIGRRDHAVELFERLQAHLDGAPGHQPDLLAWGRARCLGGEAAITAYREVLQHASTQLVATIHVDLCDELLRVRRYEEALHHVDESLGTWSLAADYNRAVALLALGRDDEVRVLADRVTSLAMGTGPSRVYVGLCYLGLFTHLDEPTPMWDGLAGLCSPLIDPILHEVLGHRLADAPPGPRRDRMLELLTP